MNKHHIYFDFAATTPLDPQVLEVMTPYFIQKFGNPSSIHFFGQEAEAALETARERVAGVLNAKPIEIIFTSGGTESDNLAIRGTALQRRNKSGCNHILISPVEHPAVLQTATQLRDVFGFELELLPVDEFGRVDADVLSSRIRQDTALVSVIYANNEIGTINPIAKIGATCRDRSVPFHTDAVQAVAHLHIDVSKESIDLLSLGAHKFYGPKGIGVLFDSTKTQIYAAQTGGKQEGNLRAGTENIPYIVGLAEALVKRAANYVESETRLIGLRDWIISTTKEKIRNSQLTGHPTDRLPNHASFVFENVDGNKLLMLLDDAGFACSSGSACKVGNPQPSSVLTALGLPRSLAMGSLRITLGTTTTEQEVDEFLKVLPDLVKKAAM
jgi:cysteine desulfurase